MDLKKRFPIWDNIFKNYDKEKLQKIDILKNTHLCKSLEKNELKKFLEILHERTYDKNEVLFKENNPGTALFIIEEGFIKIEKEVSEHEIIKLTTLEKGAFLGELSLLISTPRSASAVCLTKTKTLILFRDDFFDFIKYNPKISNKLLLNLAEIVGKRLIDTNQLLQESKTKLKETEIKTTKILNLKEKIKKLEQDKNKEMNQAQESEKISEQEAENA